MVLVTGARQVGKSTLVQALCGAEWPARYLTLDDRAVLDAALTRSDVFLKEQPTPLALDEIQRAPDLLRAIKLQVDRDRRPGMYLLTGSANVVTLRRVSETLAGRVAIHQLHPFSLVEVEGRDPGGLVERLFGEASAARLAETFPGQEVEKLVPGMKDFILRGGLPVPYQMADPVSRRTWFDGYRQTYVERDIRELFGLENLPDFARLFSLLNSRTAQLLNFAGLSRDMGLPLTTLRRYFHALEQTYQVFLLSPFRSIPAKGLTKTPKVFAADTGMASDLAGVDDWSALERRFLTGPWVETFAASELRKEISSADRVTVLHFWRTRSGQEVDFLLERQGRFAAVEVKWSPALDRKALAGLRACRDALGSAFHLGVLLYRGEQALALDDRIADIPIPAAFGGAP